MHALPLTIAILLGLFCVQYKGTKGIGRVFGPVMVTWFVTIALTGVVQVVKNPSVLWAVNPYYAVKFIVHSGFHGFIVLGSVVRRSGDTVDARDVPLLGMEGEIAFRFLKDAPARSTPYSYEDVAAMVVAFPLIEVVASRYADYASTPVVERTADMMSNGAFVVGEDQPGWRTIDLVNIPVSLTFDDKVVVERNGGHALGDPLQLAVDMVNRLRDSTGVRAGQMITTGAYTGMNVAKAGQRVSVRFGGFPVCTVTTA